MSTVTLQDLDPQYDGAALLDELRAALNRYVVLPSPEAADAVTLWIAATHGQDAWEHAPRCAVVAPEKRCGKSRLLDIAEATCHQSLVTVNISPAALVRSVTSEDPPTLFIDEADTVFGAKAGDNHEDLRGIINSGHQRGRPYIRYDVVARRNEHLPTFCMAMLAGIGDLPDTIMDRSVVVRMRRRASTEHVDPYRTRRDRPALHDLRDRLGAWVKSHVKELTAAEPGMPVEDRAADTWEPLIAIGDLAGGTWPARGRKASLVMVTLEKAADAEASMGMRLLMDIREVFATMPRVGFLPSSELTNLLRKIDDGPWSETDLTMRKLAMKLGPYGIKTRHNAAKTARGYHLDDFTDAFARYLPSPSVQASENGPENALTRENTPDTSEGLRTLEVSGGESSVRPVSAGQSPDADTWTLLDGTPRADGTCSTCQWPFDSEAHEINCGGIAA